MNAYNVAQLAKILSYHERGILSAQEVCRHFAFELAEPCSLAGYIALLPPPLLSELRDWLQRQPRTDSEWAELSLAILDGDDESYHRQIAKCRTNTEALREFFSPPIA